VHGYEVAEWIHTASADALDVEEGALYPALRRLELRGLLDEIMDIMSDSYRKKSLLASDLTVVRKALIKKLEGEE
jgi:DNA-binding PadR family transcriptional regulator